MALIELREVTKIYTLGPTRLEVLKQISLAVERGEYVALTGPSGSGKSTLLNTLGCLDRPTSGSYRLAGEEVGRMSSDQRARVRNRRIGFIFQNFNLLARTSAVENVELPMLYRGGLSARGRRDRAVELLERVGLRDRLEHQPHQLSGGQQQRVCIARALANEPVILLADEPTGNLDSKTSEDIIGLFRELNERSGLTVILVTHDPQIARNARRAIMLRDGRILEDTAQRSSHPSIPPRDRKLERAGKTGKQSRVA